MRKTIWFIALISLAMSSCYQEPEFVNTLYIYFSGGDSYELSYRVKAKEIENAGFEIDTVHFDQSVEPIVIDGELVDNLSNDYFARFEDYLPGTTYYVRAFVTDSKGIHYSSTEEFTTLPLEINVDPKGQSYNRDEDYSLMSKFIKVNIYNLAKEKKGKVKVFFNEFEVPLVNEDGTVRVPEALPEGPVTLKVSIEEDSYTIPGDWYNFPYKWYRMSELDKNPSFSFMMGRKLYLAYYKETHYEWKVFDVKTGEWLSETIPDLNASGYYRFQFIHEGMVYVGFSGDKAELYRFSFASQQWELLGNDVIPNNPKYGIGIIKMGYEAYLLKANTFEVWAYDIANNTLVQKKDNPYLTWANQGVEVEGVKGYVMSLHKGKVLSYNPHFDEWTEEGDTPESFHGSKMTLLGEKAFVTSVRDGWGAQNHIYLYDLFQNSWTPIKWPFNSVWYDRGSHIYDGKVYMVVDEGIWEFSF